jgi:cytochrome c55X
MQGRARQFPLWPSLALAFAVVPGAAIASETNADAARLASLVRQDCGSCHGLTLQGGLGKPLTSEHLRAWSREQLVGIILDGVPGTPMPPWRPLLSEAEAGWIADRLQRGDLP